MHRSGLIFQTLRTRFRTVRLTTWRKMCVELKLFFTRCHPGSEDTPKAINNTEYGVLNDAARTRTLLSVVSLHVTTFELQSTSQSIVKGANLLSTPYSYLYVCAKTDAGSAVYVVSGEVSDECFKALGPSLVRDGARPICSRLRLLPYVVSA